MLNQLSSNLSRQVRSVMTDNSGGLWFGTKGDGLLHIPDYRENEEASAVTVYSPEGKQNVVSYIRWNKEFPVYKLVQSRYMDGFWIGSGDPGLFYYSFEDKALHSVENLPAQPTEIHGIYEENDSSSRRKVIIFFTVSEKLRCSIQCCPKGILFCGLAVGRKDSYGLISGLKNIK